MAVAQAMLPIPGTLHVRPPQCAEHQVHSHSEWFPTQIPAPLAHPHETPALDPSYQELVYETANLDVEMTVPVQDCLAVDVHFRSKKSLSWEEFPRLRHCQNRKYFPDGPK